MKKSLLLVIAAATLASCGSYYQLYNVDAVDLKNDGKTLKFENEDCAITYNLWGHSGDLSFALYNKTDRDLFVVMPQSFFIKNGMAYNYYSDSEQITRTALGASSAQINTNVTWGSLLTKGTKDAAMVESTSITKSEEIICIPPHSTKIFNGFALIGAAHKDCDDFKFNYPKKSSDKITYSKEDSPWKYRNRIAYTFNAKERDCKYVDNELWVSSLQNYRDKYMTETVKVKMCETNIEEEKEIVLYSAPNAFYNHYVKTPGAKK